MHAIPWVLEELVFQFLEIWQWYWHCMFQSSLDGILKHIFEQILKLIGDLDM